MHHLLFLLLLVLTWTVSAGDWIAYHMEGRPAGVVTVGPGDLVTVGIPDTSRRKNRPVSFITTAVASAAPLGNLQGKTLSAVISLDGTGAPVWHNYVINGQTRPVAVRLWISSQAEPYSFVKVTDANQATYWWSNPVHIDLDDLWLFGPMTLQETLADPSRWSSALGKSGADPVYKPQFLATAGNVRQIGVSFGPYFFDTGVAVEAGTGTATFHLHTFSAQ